MQHPETTGSYLIPRVLVAMGTTANHTIRGLLLMYGRPILSLGDDPWQNHDIVDIYSQTLPFQCL